MARRYPDFPIVLETYRECLRDVLDLSGLQELLRGLETREVSLVEVETQHASPFAGSLLFDYVATYMYEGDTPSAERRAAALSLDRDLLRELLGQEELRELIDPAALEQIEEDLQHRSQRTQATSRDALGDVLRAVGDLRVAELSERVLAGLDVQEMLAALEHERRVVRIRIAADERLIAADDAGLYRDALGCPPPAGLPEVFLADVPDALVELVRRYARTHGPFSSVEFLDRYRVDVSSALRELESSGELVRGELRPGGAGREWCDIQVLRRLRRASLAALRKEIEPVDEHALSAFMPSWQGVDRWRPGSERGGGGVERLREVLVPLQGLALPVASWERDVLASRTGSYSPSWLDRLCASGEVVWVGAGSLGRDSGRVALYFREDAALLGRPSSPVGTRGEAPEQPEHALLRERLAAGPCFFTDLLAELELARRRAHTGAVGPGLGRRGDQRRLGTLARPTSDACRTRACGAGSCAGEAGCAREGALAAPSLRAGRFGTSAQVQGRWSLTLALFGEEAPREQSARPDAIEELRARRRALAELLLERYGVLTREQVSAEGIAGGFSALYGALTELETLGVCRRGYFVEGLGGAQFALPGAVERLRARANEAEPRRSCSRRSIPAQPYGAVLPWPTACGTDNAARRGWRARMWCSSPTSRCSTWSAADAGS